MICFPCLSLLDLVWPLLGLTSPYWALLVRLRCSRLTEVGVESKVCHDDGGGEAADGAGHNSEGELVVQVAEHHRLTWIQRLSTKFREVFTLFGPQLVQYNIVVKCCQLSVLKYVEKKVKCPMATLYF